MSTEVALRELTGPDSQPSPRSSRSLTVGCTSALPALETVLADKLGPSLHLQLLYGHDQPSITSHHRFCCHQKLFITTKIAASLLEYHMSPKNLLVTYLHVICHHQNFCQPTYMSFVITKIFTNQFTYCLSPQKFLPAYLNVILHLQNCCQPIYMPFLTYKIAAGLIGYCLLPPKLLVSLAVSPIIDESTSV